MSAILFDFSFLKFAFLLTSLTNYNVRVQVRERTARSVPMSAGGVAGRASRSSLSAGTPDSLSDNEAASGLGARYRKPSVPR